MSLLPHHEALITASAINTETSAARGYRTVTKKAEMRDLGFGAAQARVPALLIPIYNVVGDVALYQARPDVPRVKDGKVLKYETPLRSRMALDVPPGARAKLGDPKVPLFITEGVRKADAAVSKGVCCVALLGVWNWRGSNEDGGKVALPDWESIALNDRQTYVVFDSDVMLKPEVQGALSRLKAFLESRGAKVVAVYLPAGASAAKVGLDDYLAAGRGIGDLTALAAPTLRPIPTDEKPTGRSAKGRAIELDDPEPSPEPVVGAALLDEIVSIVERFIVLPSGAAVAIALWIVHTYLMDAWDVTPLLAVSSPTKRCGKTSLLRIISGLVRRPLPASGISASAIFRTVEEHEPTFMIDEMDSMKENEDLRGVLNSGHTRDLAFVIRVVGDGAAMEPRRFSTWCPKVLAHIGRLPGTLEDRAVRVSLRRKLPGEPRERIRRRRLDVILGPVRRRIARWAQDIAASLPAEPYVPENLDDRAADNWEPLLVLADAAGDRWPQLARDTAAALSSDRAQDEAEDNPGVLLLSDLQGLLDDGGPLAGEELIPADTACEELRKIPERPWATWGKGRDGLQPVHLARLLRPFDVVPKAVRIGGRGGVRRYRAGPLGDAFERYLSSSVAPATPATREKMQHANPHGSTSVADVAGGAGLDGRCGSDEEPAVQAPTLDPDSYLHEGVVYRLGDTLPDGRVFLESGPVFSRRPSVLS